MNYFELKMKWGFGHIQIKQDHYYYQCNSKEDLITTMTPQSTVYGFHFNGTKWRRRYLGPDIENSLFNVKNARQTLMYWYGLNGIALYKE